LSSSRSASPPPNPTTEICNRIESRYAKIECITLDGQTAVQRSEELYLFALLSGLPSTFVWPSPPSPTLHSRRLPSPVFGSTRARRSTWRRLILLMQQRPSSAGNATPPSTSHGCPHAGTPRILLPSVTPLPTQEEVVINTSSTLLPRPPTPTLPPPISAASHGQLG